MPNTDDTVSLTIDEQKYSGWQSVRITRGIERMPSDFALTATERDPGQPLFPPIKPGHSCRVLIGSSIVITGWVDRVMPSIDPQGHQITVLGRGRCCDLVDCSAYADNRQFLNHSVLDIATAVAKPFQIVVSQRDPGTPALPNEKLTAAGQVIPQYNVNLTTTAWEIIEQISRYACLLAYENEYGNLLLAQVGTASAASGFKLGINVQAAASMASVDQRYSTVWAVALAVDSTLPLTPGAPPAPGAPVGGGPYSPNIIAHPEDREVRYRPLVIVSEQGHGWQDVTRRRAEWEIARRYGRSQAVTLTTDTWRDSAGDLWAPNTLAPLDIPDLRLSKMRWLITEISFIVDLQRGQVADITLMPPDAFTPQPPTTLFDGQLQEAMRQAAPPAPVSTSGLQGRA